MKNTDELEVKDEGRSTMKTIAVAVALALGLALGYGGARLIHRDRYTAHSVGNMTIMVLDTETGKVIRCSAYKNRGCQSSW